jgi:hypothetical protein
VSDSDGGAGEEVGFLGASDLGVFRTCGAARFSPPQIANGDAVDGGSLGTAGCYVCADWTPEVLISIS